MVLRNKYTNYTRGFSLIELLVVISIFVTLILVSDSIYKTSQVQTNLDLATHATVEAMRYAQTNAEQVKDDSLWGVEIQQSGIVIFRGSNFSTRDQGFDQPLAFPPGVSANGLSEVIFSKVSGNPSTTGTTTLGNSEGSRYIFINEKGTITY